ncbi:glycosyltransferase [Schlesneria sp. T3-172]|uniref:glycosyltransferase n=1 Tax=Schlesneria sphaerica TaxID=3373610 RepID=UPI0037C5E770
MPPEAIRDMPHPVGGRSGTISIALCTYNGERYLPAQLDSYLSQSRLPDELVVGDDGSTDSTARLIEDFARVAPFPVRFFQNPQRLGVGANFDQTLQRCAGEFIALSDQDDEWRPDKLARLAALLGQHPQAGYACSDAEMIGNDGQPQHHRLWEQYRCTPHEFLQQGDSSARHLLLQSDRILGATMLLRANCIRALSPIPQSWVHDHWLSVMCELMGYHGVASPELLTRYRLHPGQTCGVRRPVGRYRQKRLGFSRRCEQRLRRRERLSDLRLFLEERLIPVHPELTRWQPVIAQAEELADQAIWRDSLPWWRRKLIRLQQWWQVKPTPSRV